MGRLGELLQHEWCPNVLPQKTVQCARARVIAACQDDAKLSRDWENDRKGAIAAGVLSAGRTDPRCLVLPSVEVLGDEAQMLAGLSWSGLLQLGRP